MAKAPKTTGAISPPDFEQALKIYRADVVPAAKAQKQAMQDQGTAWKEIKKGCRVHKPGFSTAMKVAEMEEADQQAWLRSFAAGLRANNVTLHIDLADIANGADKDGSAEIIPTGSKPETELTTLN
jgi:hypothetical protein